MISPQKKWGEEKCVESEIRKKVNVNFRRLFDTHWLPFALTKPKREKGS